MNDYLQKETMEKMMLQPVPGKRIEIVRLQMVREERSLYGIERFSEPKTAAEMMQPILSLADRELFLVMSVNTKMEPVAVEVVAIGSLNACLTEPREIFKHAILNNAAGIVCFHNHPSGKAEPSRNDGLMTQRLVKAGEILGIPVVDHIIVAGEEYYSFKQDGKLTAA